MSPTGRPEGECRSAQRAGHLERPTGRPEGECRSAQREGHLERPQGPPGSRGIRCAGARDVRPVQ